MGLSSYVLRRMHRVDEAKERIEEALKLLRETNDYPKDQIEPGQETESVLRAGRFIWPTRDNLSGLPKFTKSFSIRSWRGIRIRTTIFPMPARCLESMRH